MLPYGLIFTLITVVAWAVSNILTKLCATDYGAIKTSVISIGAGLIPNLVLYPFYATAITGNILLVGLCAGILFAIGYILFFDSLKTEQASNTYALTLIQSIAIGIFGIVVLSEPISVLGVMGCFVGVLGVLLVSTTKGFSFDKLLLAAIFGNIVWSFGWFVVDYSVAAGYNLVVLLGIQRAVATVLVVMVWLFYHRKTVQKKMLSKSALKIALVMGIAGGILSGVGNLAFAYLADLNFVTIGSILTAFVPVLVAIMAIFVYRERMTRTQWLGVVLATIGAIAIVA